MKWVFLCAFILLLGGLIPVHGWINASINNRIEFTITNNAGAPLTNYEISINSSSDLSTGFDTASLIAAGYMQADCDDSWIVDGADSNYLMFYIENGTCNSANTIYYFVTNLTTGANNFYLYFNASDAANHEDKYAVPQQVAGNYAHYDFAEGSGTVFNDTGKLGNNGTLNNGANFNFTGRGYSLGLAASGNTDFGQLAGYLSNGTATYTIKFWMNPEATQVNPEATVFSDQGTGGSSGTNGIALENATFNGSAGYHFMIGNTAGSDWEFTRGFFPTANVWNYVTLVKNGTNYTVYLNGVSATSELHGTTVQKPPDYAFYFGRFSHASPARYFNGDLDGFIWLMGYPATAEEVKADYDGLSWAYGSIENNVPATCYTVTATTIIIPISCAFIQVLGFTAV